MSQLPLRLYPDLAGLRQATRQDHQVLARIQAGLRPDPRVMRRREELDAARRHRVAGIPDRGCLYFCRWHRNLLSGLADKVPIPP